MLKHLTLKDSFAFSLIQFPRLMLLLLLFTSVLNAEVNKHEHTGILTPYTVEPEVVELSVREQKKLAKGETVYKKQLVGDSKRAIVIFQVNAPSDTIWSVIKDFDHYPDWIEDITSTEVYEVDGSHIYVRFNAENKYAGESTWYAKHNYPDNNRSWGTWTLDYDYASDLDDSVGFWHVKESETDPASSIVVYSATLKLKSKVPQFIVNLIVKTRLKQATVWVREQSELREDNSQDLD